MWPRSALSQGSSSSYRGKPASGKSMQKLRSSVIGMGAASRAVVCAASCTHSVSGEYCPAGYALDRAQAPLSKKCSGSQEREPMCSDDCRLTTTLSERLRVRGSPIDTVRLSQTSGNCMACRRSGVSIPLAPPISGSLFDAQALTKILTGLGFSLALVCVVFVVVEDAVNHGRSPADRRHDHVAVDGLGDVGGPAGPRATGGSTAPRL